jgi:hypothetical protein
LRDFPGKPLRVFAVWEPVLATDWASPSTAVLRRLSDARAAQFWDKDRSISHSMGEHDRHGIVWDRILVYPRGAVWAERPPKPVYSGGTVVSVTDAARAAIGTALEAAQKSRRQ